MNPFTLAPHQLDVIKQPLDQRIFLEGPAGTGKTTTGVERLLYLMEQGVPGSVILVLAPQRTLLVPYLVSQNTPGAGAGGQVTMLTIAGLAQRMIDLFWPLIAEKAGFSDPNRSPIYLTLETAQYYMSRLVRPLLAEGFFESVVIDRNRLYSQVLDNLNKAALVGFAHTEIGTRLKAAWSGSSGQGRIYEDAQECASRFRQYCLANNLLDFSLQIEVFTQHLWSTPLYQEYITCTYRHVIADNLEEEPPVTHDLLRTWLPRLDSAFLIFDQHAGYRHFLGADPQTTYTLKELCSEQVVFNESFVNTAVLVGLEERLTPILLNLAEPLGVRELGSVFNIHDAVDLESLRYFPQMLDYVVSRVAELVNQEGLPPGEIVVLAPFLSDALRFSLTNRLERFGIPARSHRPSRTLRDEPAVQCMFSLACLAHPHWTGIFTPTRFDFAYALVQAIEGMDLVRAQLLAEIVYRKNKGDPTLLPFERIKPEMQERITYRFGGSYERLRLWLEEYRQGSELELDHFFSRLFGEVLSQPSYGFHANFSAGEMVANLIESIQKFRWAASGSLAAEGWSLGREYMQVVTDGVISAQYLRSWHEDQAEAVLLAPAYTYLMSNRPVEVQFWLDIGSRGWFERLFQPLTQPYVLNRNWSKGELWTDADEFEAGRQSLYRLVLGLLRRCRRKIIICNSELGEQGFEQRGQLLYAFQRLFQQFPREGNGG